MLMIQTRPSRMSSPRRLESSFFRIFLSRPYSFMNFVNEDLNPVRWVPPSTVLMLLAKAWIDSS